MALLCVKLCYLLSVLQSLSSPILALAPSNSLFMLYWSLSASNSSSHDDPPTLGNLGFTVGIFDFLKKKKHRLRSEGATVGCSLGSLWGGAFGTPDGPKRAADHSAGDLLGCHPSNRCPQDLTSACSRLHPNLRSGIFSAPCRWERHAHEVARRHRAGSGDWENPKQEGAYDIQGLPVLTGPP